MNSPSVDCPVFRPTLEEFGDFSAYVASITDIARPYGICKVVAPDGWSPRSTGYDDSGISLAVTTPIKQIGTGACVFSNKERSGGQVGCGCHVVYCRSLHSFYSFYSFC